MATFTWTVAAPSTPTSSAPAPSDETAPPSTLFGALDQEIDPVTRDYVDTTDGAWLETAASRAAVMMQLEIRYNEWHVDPDAGSRIPAMLESGDPVTAQEVVDETRRALQVLVVDGVISDLSVEEGELDQDTGRFEVLLTYTDVVTGHAVEAVFSPF